MIENLDDSVENVAIFSHNNGITYFANSLTNENIEHMPTCSVVAFKIDTKNWAECCCGFRPLDLSAKLIGFLEQKT